VLLPILLLLAAAHRQAKPADEPGSTLIITYPNAPANRIVLQQELRKMAAGELQQLKAAGSLESYQVLFSRYANAEGWDAMVLLNFANDGKLGH
jgi:hypothetical protein